MGRAGGLLLSLTLFALTLVTAACGDDPFELDWVPIPDTIVLYSLARGEIARPSAFNLNERSTVHIEVPGATGQWDFAVDTRTSQIVLLPPGALGVISRARIAALPGQSFAQVKEAPADTTVYAASVPVPARLGTTYVVRTDARPTQFGGSCTYYGKLEPLAIDVPGGTLQFVYDVNPVCNDRKLVPPDSL